MAIKKVLVTGGFGYVGSRLTPLLLENGYEVNVIDLMLYGEYGLESLKSHPSFSTWGNKFQNFQGDIRDPNAVREAISGCQAVIHLAAISNDPTGDLDEILTKQVNFDAVGLLVSLAKESGVERFINASSSSVFGVKSESNITEELEPEPITFYSKYKMLSEWLLKSNASKEFCTVNIRPATVCGYSPRQRLDLTVNKLTADGVRKKVITVHGGQQRRPNVGMTDMINIYLKLLDMNPEKINGKTFNFGFENHKVIDIASIIKSNLTEELPEIKVTETQDKRDYHICSDKILDTISYEPISSIESEVANLKVALKDQLKDEDTDAARFYNMKMMKLNRNSASYSYLSK